MGTNGDARKERAGSASGVEPGAEKGRWLSLEEAAVFLSMPVRMLREALAKRAHTMGERKEANLDGILARKIGRRWKVWFAVEWTAPAPTVARAMLRSAENAGHGGKEFPHGSA